MFANWPPYFNKLIAFFLSAIFAFPFLSHSIWLAAIVFFIVSFWFFVPKKTSPKKLIAATPEKVALITPVAHVAGIDEELIRDTSDEYFDAHITPGLSIFDKFNNMHIDDD